MCKVTPGDAADLIKMEYGLEWQGQVVDGSDRNCYKTRLPTLAASCYVVRVASSALLVLRGSHFYAQVDLVANARGPAAQLSLISLDRENARHKSNSRFSPKRGTANHIAVLFILFVSNQHVTVCARENGNFFSSVECLSQRRLRQVLPDPLVRRLIQNSNLKSYYERRTHAS